MIEQNQDLTNEQAPHVVAFQPSIKSNEGREIWPWFRDNATGEFKSMMITNRDGSFNGWMFHFTDPDTAFCFRMRFGGQ